MGNISTNFSYREFERSSVADHNGIINVIISTEVRNSVKALVEDVLQPLRDAWREPLTVNSGYRCPELNDLVGGEKTSQHLKGEAADIGTTFPVELARLAKRLRLPYDQVIIYPTFVHISHKLHGRQRREMFYSRTWKGEKVLI